MSITTVKGLGDKGVRHQSNQDMSFEMHAGKRGDEQ